MLSLNPHTMFQLACAFLACLFFYFITWSNTSLASDCALLINSVDDDAAAYRSRGNRCEGMYRQKVSGRVNLRVVGYHHNRLQFDENKDDQVVLRVVSGSQLPSPNLTVVSLRPKDYYQMDTNQLSSGRFVWKLDVLKEINDPPLPRQLSALGCSAGCVRSSETARVLHPVIFGSVPVEKDTALILVMADVELISLTATVKVEGANAPLMDNKVVGGRTIPANRAQRILVKGLEGRVGFLELRAVTHSGRRAHYAAQLWPVTGTPK